MEESLVTLESPRIETLSDAVASQIAAGEVVERPASVLKELLENALDAGAGKIDIEIHGAGRKSIRVVDDGCGMGPEDCRRAFGRHATSKLREIVELESISTMGFRGEALYAIAAVSELTLASCPAGAKTGWKVELSGGSLASEGAAPPLPGTSIEVRNLFFNVPARLKFLKTDAIERSRMARVVEEVALARPGLSLTLRMEGKLALRLGPAEGAGALETRAGETLGVGLAEGLIPVEAERPECKIKGLVSAPDALIGSRNAQYFFVNGRPVGARLLQQALYKCYEGRENKHPACVLFIELPGEAVDVNVHPQKLEVRFKNEARIWELMSASVGRAITLAQNPAPMSSDAPPPDRGFFRKAKVPLLSIPSNQVKELPSYYQAQTPAEPSLEAGAASAAPSETAPIPPRESAQAVPVQAEQPALIPAADAQAPAWYTPPFRFLGQIEKSYLVFDAAGSLLLVDQHAAAERIAYEKYMGEAALGHPATQNLILPLEVELSPAEFQRLSGLREELSRSGFDNEVFGERTLLVHSMPDAFPLDAAGVKELFARLAETLDAKTAGEETLHEKVATIACKAAIKAHERVGEREALKLIEDLKACRAPLCPHGRPALIAMDRGELARRFKRPGPPPLE